MTNDGLPPLREVIKELSLSAKKSLGQNFILDLNLTRRIARSGGFIEGKTIVEIGPGPGGLTRGLLMEGAAKVIAIEKDERCLPALQQIADHYPGRLEIISGDALEIDIKSYLDGPARIIANLPYSVGTALLIHWLEEDPWPPWYESMTLMFQKEVAMRIVASEGSKAYGRLAVFCHWRTDPSIVLKLPAKAFTPPPKVDSALVHLVPKEKPQCDCTLMSLEKVTSASFGQRRKMLRQSLKALGIDHISLLEKAGIDPQVRAEKVPIADFYKLAKLLDDAK